MIINKYFLKTLKHSIYIALALCLLPSFGWANELLPETATINIIEAAACDFEAKLLIERSPKCGNLGGIVSVWVTGNEEEVSYFWKADGGEMFSTGTVNTLENVPADVTHWAIIRDASGCEIMLDFELAEQPCDCPLTARAVINKYPECDGANGSVRIDYWGDQGTVTFDSDWGDLARRDNLPAGQYSVSLTDDAGCVFTVDFDLTEGTCCQNYAATAVVNKLPDCGESNGSVSINVVGQTGALTYSWGEGNRMDNLATGEYWVVVKDATGCTVTVYFKIEGEGCCVDSDLMARADIHQQPECGKNIGSASVIATGGVAPYTYSWGGQTRYDNLVPGTYRVIVTDAFGCTVEVNFDLTTPENCCTDSNFEAEAIINQHPECGKTNGSVTINGIGGVAPYKYSWGEPFSYNNLYPGNYVVTVTDAFGCTDVVNFTLIQEDCCKDSDLAVTPIINQHPTCGKKDGDVRLEVTGGQAPYAYSWGVKSNYDNLIPGDYTVTITDAFDCSTVTVFTLIEGPCCPNFLVEFAIKDPTNCDQNDGAVDFMITGTTGSQTYSWDDGLITTDAFRTSLTDRTYEVTITDDLLDCEQIIKLPIKTFKDCTSCALVATLVDTVGPSCAQPMGGRASIVVTGATNTVSYAWSDGSTASTRTDLKAGEYTVIIKESETCGDTIKFTFTAPVDCGDPPPCDLSVSATVKAADCQIANGAIEVIVTNEKGTVTYEWADNSTLNTAIRSGLAIGTYTVIVTDSINCKDTLAISISENCCFQIKEVQKSDPTCANNNGIVTINVEGAKGMIVYEWSDGVMTTNSRRDNLMPGTYTVKITDSANPNCIDSVNVALNEPSCCFVAGYTILKEPMCDAADGSVEITVTGNKNPVRFIWNGDTLTTAIRTGIDAGSYQVIIIEEGTTCADTLNFILTKQQVTLSSEASSACDTMSFIKVAVVGGNENHTFIWSDGGASIPNRTGLALGNYTVTVTNVNTTCFAIDSFLIEEPMGPNISIGTIETACEGDTIQLMVNGTELTDSIKWLVPDGLVLIGQQSITPLVYSLDNTDGVFTVIVEVSNTAGCISRDTTQVTFEPNDPIKGDFTFEQNCENLTVSFEVVNDNASSYTWNFGDPNNPTGSASPQTMHTYTEAGIYEVTLSLAKNPDCAQPSDTIIRKTITVNPAVDIDVGFDFTDLHPCEDTTQIAFLSDAEITNGLIDSFIWIINGVEYPNEKSPIVEVVRPATLTVSLEVFNNASNCPISKIVTETIVMEPIPTLIGDNFVCEGTMVTLGSSDSSIVYIWEPNDCFPTNEQNPKITLTESKIFRAKVMQGEQCYYFENNYLVTPNPIIDSITPDIITCEDTLAQIEVFTNEGFNIAWSTSSDFSDTISTDNSLLASPGKYFVRVVEPFFSQCKTIDSVYIESRPIEIMFDTMLMICGPGTLMTEVVNLNLTDTLSFAWQPETSILDSTFTTNKPIFDVTESTVFTFDVTNQFGCSFTDSISVEVIDTSMLVGHQVLATPGKIPLGGTSELMINPPLPDGFMVEWVPNSTLTDLGDMASVKPEDKDNARYFATIFNEDLPNCAVSRDTSVWLVCSDDALFFPNAFSPNDDGINDVLRVRGAEGFGTMNLIVYNRWGEKVFESSDPEIGWDGRFEGKKLTADVYGYYLTVTCPTTTIVKKGNVTLLK